MDAYALDRKIDDGYPTSGTMRAWGGGGGDNSGVLRALSGGFQGVGGAGTDYCADTSTSPTSYNVKTALRTSNSLCALTLRSSF